MYNEDVTRTPKDDDELWDVLREQFEFVRNALWETTVESRDEAIANTHHRVSGTGSVRRDGMNVIRYRDVGDGLNNRDHFLGLGRELLPFIDQEIDLRRMSPEFVQKWGMVMFCHGYVASHILDDSDDLGPTRAGLKTGKARSKNAQRKWLSHVMVPLLDAGKRRSDAETYAVKLVKAILAQGAFPPGFGSAWFISIVTRDGLAATYDEKHLSVKKMRELANTPADDIPPTRIP